MGHWSLPMECNTKERWPCHSVYYISWAQLALEEGESRTWQEMLVHSKMAGLAAMPSRISDLQLMMDIR